MIIATYGARWHYKIPWPTEPDIHIDVRGFQDSSTRQWSEHDGRYPRIIRNIISSSGFKRLMVELRTMMEKAEPQRE